MEERIFFVKRSTKSIKNIEVKSINGLITDFARFNKIKILLRSVRTAIDFEYEEKLANLNKKIAKEIETVFLFSSYEFSFISSSSVKEIAYHGGDISKFIPSSIRGKLIKIIYKKIRSV
ncbi:Phosphopantetheine adenylyltransferase [Candidatus Riesia pediculischaeffi PTSU]|uniref:Pantetheine-phosphate adenylyltransferase n=1 Tax=Candidatus Riesia pediculischaeffi PTSU TaxID=1401651 RepID=A0A0C1S0X0_9ENTR|nr:Phosphopantetheine adenylyltransferase [Candidatus Riesia pediculischaeffi PTSU]